MSPSSPSSSAPGGTFGMDPLRRAPIRATVTPIVPDAVDTAAEDFFTAQPEPTVDAYRCARSPGRRAGTAARA